MISKIKTAIYLTLFLTLLFQFVGQVKEEGSKVNPSSLIPLVRALEKVSETGEQLRKEEKSKRLKKKEAQRKLKK